MRWSIILLVLLWNVDMAHGECSTLPTFEHAFVSEEYKKAEYRKGDVIYFSCEPGYSTGLNTTYVCTEQGWRAATFGQCFESTGPVPLGCTPPPSIQNGYLSERSFYFYVNGKRVGYRCNDTYKLTGQRYKTCNNGQWTGDVKCVTIQCQAPLTLDLGEVAVDGDLDRPTFGSVLRFSCRERGDALIGASQINCDENGEWSGPVPTCRGAHDCMLESFKQYPLFDENFELSNFKPSYSSGENVRVPCKVGYRGFFRLICSEGKWFHRGDKCAVISCGRPGDAPFAEFRLVEGSDYTFGSQVLYTCLKGYQMVNYVATRNCLQDGWDGHLPECAPLMLETTDTDRRL